MANFLSIFISITADLFSFAIIARILMSWFPGGADQLRSALRDITEPFLAFFRNYVPRIGMIDISPIVALVTIDILKYVLLTLVTYVSINL